MGGVSKGLAITGFVLSVLALVGFGPAILLPLAVMLVAAAVAI